MNVSEQLHTLGLFSSGLYCYYCTLSTVLFLSSLCLHTNQGILNLSPQSHQLYWPLFKARLSVKISILVHRHPSAHCAIASKFFVWIGGMQSAVQMSSSETTSAKILLADESFLFSLEFLSSYQPIEA